MSDRSIYFCSVYTSHRIWKFIAFIKIFAQTYIYIYILMLELNKYYKLIKWPLWPQRENECKIKNIVFCHFFCAISILYPYCLFCLVSWFKLWALNKKKSMEESLDSANENRWVDKIYRTGHVTVHCLFPSLSNARSTAHLSGNEVVAANAKRNDSRQKGALSL